MSALISRIAKITEDMKGVWTLLDSTAVYLKIGEMFGEYEFMFQQWRNRLLEGRNSSDTYRNVKSEIIMFRKALRNDGHDLRMSGKDLKVVGFRSDDGIKSGFKRAVVYFGERKISYLSGVENHIDLSEKFFNLYSGADQRNYESLHYIWFRWIGNILEIAGSDTESADHYERLCGIVREKKMIVLSMLGDIS